MKVSVIGSTKPGFELDVKSALDFGGKSAGICYLSNTFDDILKESEEKTQKRINQTLNNKHHSVYDHVSYNLLLQGVPKILAMIINNEKQYTTSEKSARYTQMELVGEEKLLYDKWLNIFIDKISEKYPEMDEKKVLKLAQENARGLTSVFTITTMEYTTTLRQLNNIMHMFNEYIEQETTNEFEIKIKKYMKEFNDNLQYLYIEELYDKSKRRRLSLFDNMEKHNEIYDEVYCSTYKASFAQLAQAQRHRTLNYSIKVLEKPEFFTPIIIKDDTELSNDWINDISKLKDNYPQSMYVDVCERGTYEDFALKCVERLCSCAQLEISLQTRDTLDKYLEGVKNTNKEVYEYLKDYDVGGRCGIKGYRCSTPCNWGVKQLQRLV